MKTRIHSSARHAGARASRAGFTIAEAAVTIAIVALVLTTILQSLEGAKISALHTMLQKTARELGLEMLGEIEAGRWQDEIDSGASGSFANRDESEFSWELALGDDAFPDRPDESYDDQYRPFDNFRAREEWRDQNSDNSEVGGENADEEEEAQPFEKVKLRIRFPQVRELSNEIILERWVRWAQVYGEEEEEEVPTAQDPNTSGGASGTGEAGSGGTEQGGTNK
jgi:hypothetical protein